MPIKTLGSGLKVRVGREAGNRTIFYFGLSSTAYLQYIQYRNANSQTSTKKRHKEIKKTILVSKNSAFTSQRIAH